MQNYTVGRFTIDVYTPDTPGSYPLLLVHNDFEEGRCMYTFGGGSYSLVRVGGIQWEKDMSPWAAKKVCKGCGDFLGGADEYINTLTREILPKAEEVLAGDGISVTYRAIAGYSLAGLFALYCLYSTPIFNTAIAASASFWYDGFTDYMRQHKLADSDVRAYLSIGEREKLTRSARMACVEDKAREAYDILRAQGADVTFVLNPGNHFTDTQKRMLRGVAWALDIPKTI